MTRQQKSRERKLARGECARCPSDREWPKTLCVACLAKQREQTRNRTERGRL